MGIMCCIPILFCVIFAVMWSKRPHVNADVYVKPVVEHHAVTVVQPTPPPVHVQMPSVHMSMPAVHMEMPSVHMSAPGMHISSPGIHMSAPGMHVSAPGMHVSAPGMHMSMPGMSVGMEVGGHHARPMHGGISMNVDMGMGGHGGFGGHHQENPFGHH